MSSDPSRPAPQHEARLRAVAEAFAIPGRWLYAAPYGNGHINETLLAVFECGDGRAARYIQQRINRSVFREPERLMENIARVTAHQHAVLARERTPDAARRALALVPTRDGAHVLVDADGECWRTYHFIEGASSHDVVRSAADALAVAEAFGRFQAQLADLPGGRLHETIPRFHHARDRFEALRRVAREDPHGRLAGARPEFAFIAAREGIVDRLQDARARGALPERVAHNDTKLNNVLLDDETGEPMCIIDLDTVMPGLVLHDFGDLVRTATSPAAEDERDLSRVGARAELFAALVEGYLRGAGGFLVPAERAELAFAGRLVTLMLGMRFLTDHLAGDRYFRIHRAGHNLDRCRVQLRLVESLEQLGGRLSELVECAEARRRLLAKVGP
jgi:aminoglycoside phosphotransferase (APT) family kinase protein